MLCSLYHNPDQDDRIYDCLLTSMAAVQAEDVRASFLFVGDLNHQMMLSSEDVVIRGCFHQRMLSSEGVVIRGCCHQRVATSEDVDISQCCMK